MHERETGSARFNLTAAARLQALDRAQEALADVRGVRVAFAFGSLVEGKPFRDLDVGVHLTEPFDWRVLSDVEERLWWALDRPRYRLDVVPLNDAPPQFRWTVVRANRVLFELEDGDGAEYRLRCWSERADWLDWLETRSWV